MTKMEMMDINANIGDGSCHCSSYSEKCFYTPNIDAIPPEIGSHLCQFLTASDLQQVGVACPSLHNHAHREMIHRYEEHQGKVLTTSTDNLISGTDAIARYFPGLLMLYRDYNTVCPFSHCPLSSCPALPLPQNCPVLRLTKPLLSNTTESGDRLQAVSFPPFTGKEDSSNAPRCYRLYIDDSDEQAALILFKADKTSLPLLTRLCAWNIATKSSVSSIMPPESCSVQIPVDNAMVDLAGLMLQDSDPAQVTELVHSAQHNEERQVNLVSSEEEIAIIVTDRDTPSGLEGNLEKFFGKIYKPHRLCWIKIRSISLRKDSLTSMMSSITTF